MGPPLKLHLCYTPMQLLSISIVFICVEIKKLLLLVWLESVTEIRVRRVIKLIIEQRRAAYWFLALAPCISRPRSAFHWVLHSLHLYAHNHSYAHNSSSNKKTTCNIIKKTSNCHSLNMKKSSTSDRETPSR